MTNRHYRLYDLIFRRFIASQMKPARVRKQRAEILVEARVPDEEPKKLVKEIERVVEIVEKAWLDIYPVVRPEKPLVKAEYEPVGLRAIVWSPVQLLSQADVVRLMKERGIGRPSTYAKIIETLMKRGYVVSSGRASKMVATKRGIGVYNFLMRRFPSLVSEEVTRKLQETMDKIEEGTVDYQQVLDHVLAELARALTSPESGLTREEAHQLLPL